VNHIARVNQQLFYKKSAILLFVMVEFAETLLGLLREKGFQAEIVSVSHLQQLQKEIERLHSIGLLDDQFYKDRLDWFDFQIPENLPEAKSLIVVAVPRPQTRAIFIKNGRRLPLIIPPTYTADTDTKEQIEDFIAKVLGEWGYRSAGTALPLKLLAVCSGLARYGKNNICYVSEMGSFFQLVAVYSDIPLSVDFWQEAAMLERCEKCDLCRRACPSNAITRERFLLRAERCIVYHNEKSGDIPFPKWMDISWHNCIIGCMHCQRVCPENNRFLKWIGEEEEFSEEETALILRSASQNMLPASTLRKLKHLSLTDYLDCLPRNLSVFFK
jgi:epoxyqueuosine reductase